MRRACAGHAVAWSQRWQRPAAYGPSTSQAQTLCNAPQHTVPAAGSAAGEGLAASGSILQHMGPAQAQHRHCATLPSTRCQRWQHPAAWAQHRSKAGPAQRFSAHDASASSNLQRMGPAQALRKAAQAMPGIGAGSTPHHGVMRLVSAEQGVDTSLNL